MNPWNPTEDTRIYHNPHLGESGRDFDPLGLRQEFVLASNGEVWETQNRRHAAASALNNPDTPAEGRAAAEVDLAKAERRLAGWTMEVLGNPKIGGDRTCWVDSEELTEAEALRAFDHFLGWLNEVKGDTRD